MTFPHVNDSVQVGDTTYYQASGTTNITGTGTIYGNFYGNNASQITLTITPGTGNATNTSCFDNMTVTKGTLSGGEYPGDDEELTYTWSAQFDETVTSSSVPTYNINVALANEP